MRRGVHLETIPFFSFISFSVLETRMGAPFIILIVNI